MILYVVAAVTVRLADEGGRIALILLALDRLHRPDAGGLLVAALMIPHVVAAPSVGVLTDWRRPHLVIGGLALGFAAALGVTAAVLGHVPLGVAVAVLLVGGSCGPGLTGGLSSQLSRLVPPESRPQAFGIDSLTYNVAGIGGPALVGVTASVFGATAACLTMAGLAAAGAIGAVFVRAGEPPHRGTRPSLTAGLRAIFTHRRLGIVIAVSTAGQLGPGAVPVIVALAAEAQHHASAAGLMLAAVAAGGLAGSLLWTARPAPAGRAPALMMLGMCATGLPLLIGVVTTSLPWLTVALGLSGLFLGPMVGALFTSRDALAPDEVRGQVFTIAAGTKITAVAAGAALAGVLSGWPLPVLFLLAGLNPILAGLGGLLALRTSPEPSRLSTVSP